MEEVCKKLKNTNNFPLYYINKITISQMFDHSQLALAYAQIVYRIKNGKDNKYMKFTNVIVNQYI